MNISHNFVKNKQIFLKQQHFDIFYSKMHQAYEIYLKDNISLQKSLKHFKKSISQAATFNMFNSKMNQTEDIYLKDDINLQRSLKHTKRRIKQENTSVRKNL